MTAHTLFMPCPGNQTRFYWKRRKKTSARRHADDRARSQGQLAEREKNLKGLKQPSKLPFRENEKEVSVN